MRTKIAMMVALGVVLAALVVGSGTALAQQVIGGVIQCETTPCVATGAHQILFERVGDGVPDRMIAKGGHDHLDARSYTNDRDVTKGNGGNDPGTGVATSRASAVGANPWATSTVVRSCRSAVSRSRASSAG